jgi:predicted RNA-binding protein YlxR (DUF448 family)
MSTRPATPVRMCIGCGKRERQSELLRFTRGPKGMLVSGQGKGRGGYLHPRRECLRAFAASRSGFVRSLKGVVSREARERYVTLIEPSIML